MTLCKVRNAFMKILSVQKNTFRSMWAGGEEALWYLLFHKAVERNFLLYSEASVDDQTGVCVAENSKAGRQAVVLSSARNSMTERTEKMSMLTKVKVGKCSNHFNQNVLSHCLSINCPEMTSKSPEWLLPCFSESLQEWKHTQWHHKGHIYLKPIHLHSFNDSGWEWLIVHLMPSCKTCKQVFRSSKIIILSKSSLQHMAKTDFPPVS